ncbi:O-succinylbenzoate synthase [Vibrio ponticus]|nr:O-succinylbenzoate synthase [Vibrio ponticus]
MRKPDFKLDDFNGVKTIIIKPTLIGSIQLCLELIARAKELGIKTVISSSIESSIGLTQLARIAKWQLPDEVPGLDTIGLFTEQLETPWPESPLPLRKLSDQALIWQA